ncbi:heavy-metal-associated domain-containing protein [Aureibacillus halotolerans]|uniref:Uncharacterized protein n=1 Tax=Aureibacillus halotolerans TaxID=1508390 RepID=A0A4R6U9S0_9BACI|nr:heavy metal-associated domain-containing protein [Aureibacillus halotolerans]TDQ41435.1 hypothetical protein EV213_10312 [Aureibacillus halotolerans]
MKIAIWRHVLLVSTLLSVGLFTVLFTGGEHHARAKQDKIVFTNVVGTCEHCEVTPDKVMKKLLGVQNTYMTTEGHLIVWYDDEATRPEWLAQSLKSSGYKPKGVLK